MKFNRVLLGLSLAGLLTSAAQAATVTFVPPNDTSGSITTTNDNDGYLFGRGLVFRATTAQIIDSIGIYLDVTDALLNWVIYQTTGITGDIATGQIALQSGSLQVTTSGLEWVDIPVSSLALVANGTYHLSFTHEADGNQNFFYNNANATWTQGVFTLIDGTGNGDTGNTVVPAIRLNTVNVAAPDPGSEVPEPSSLWLAGGAVVALFGARRRIVRY